MTKRVLDQLVAVAVAGDHDDRPLVVPGPGGERGDHVVGLVAGHLEDGDGQRLDHLADEADLLAQDVGRGGAVGLVGVDLLVAERRLGPVEGHGDPSGRWSRSRLMSIDVKPNTAFVTWPDAVAMSAGRAKNAR